MYMMNSTHKQLFSTITACVKSSDAEVNKMTRNLKHIRLKQLGVRKEFEENLPVAKMELAKLNKFGTPLGRLFCLKRVVSALTKPLKKANVSQGKSSKNPFYMVCVFSVTMFVYICLCVCLFMCVLTFFRKRFLRNYLTYDFEIWCKHCVWRIV